MHHDEDLRPRSWWRSPPGLVLLAALALGGYYLFTEHAAHLYGLLSFLLILACPLMHLFMHRGHGHGGHLRADRPPAGDEPRT